MADDDDLVDYEDEVPEVQGSGAAKTTGATGGDVKKGSYVGIHSSGFKDFLLKPELLRAVTDCGFEHPSEVQHECIPQAVLGMDIICQAKPGMGKTAVFVLATLHQLVPEDKTISVLVLCHTRELAFQIHHEYERFSKYLKDVKSAVFFGGQPVQKDKEALKANTPNIVIGTPGRILHLANDGAMDLSKVKHFVLDECDRMLGGEASGGRKDNLSMRRDVQKIFEKTPHDKQVMMFSATLPKEIRPVCKKFTQDALEVYIDDETKLILHGLQQYYVELKEEEKNRKLNDLLDSLEFNQVIIFVSKPQRAEELGRLLKECGFPAIVSHGGMDNQARLARLDEFKRYQARILVTTDLFGRGIDLERVNISISYDMAADADSHLHRINRAGRFGTKGLAISFVSSPADKEVLATVQSRFEIKIETTPDKIDPSTYMVA